jgi:hypothetical protein
LRARMSKIVLQQNRHEGDVRPCPLFRRSWSMSGHTTDIAESTLMTPLRTFSRVLTLLETRPEPELSQPTSLHLA